jgi:hypothetical protein
MSIQDIISEINEKLNLLEIELNNSINKLCKEEHLDVKKVQSYFLKCTIEKSADTIIQEKSEPLLDATKIKDKTYYYENKPNGKVFNETNDEVGSYINNKVVLKKVKKTKN